MVLFRNETDKTIGSVPNFFLYFPACKHSPLFGTDRSASVFPEPGVLLRQPFTVNFMRFTPYILAVIWRIKRRKLQHEKLQQNRGTKRLVSVNICSVEGNSAGIFVSKMSLGIFVIKEK